MLSIKNACQQLSFNIRKVSNYNKLGHAQIGLFNQVLSLNCGHSLYRTIVSLLQIFLS